MGHRINARIDDELRDKLIVLQELTQRSLTEIVRAALELYHDTVVARGPRAASLFHQAGFVGCASGPADLSQSYKEELAEGFAAKL